ncbi:hypothetical protein ACQ4PT_024871 [Festuca glaucescens]
MALCPSTSKPGPINFVLAPYDGNLPQLVYNPYSWSKMASIIFLDSPSGSGFSYARDPEGYDVGDMSSSLQVVTFLNKWLNDHPRYRSNEFYLGGSSYAGKMIPLIVQYISEGSKFDDFNSRILYSHGVGIISDQLYEAAMENCKGDYISTHNAMCAGVLNKIEKLISEVDDDHILDDKCVSDSPKHANDDASRNRFLSEENIKPSVPSHPTINCFSYRYYLADIWANEQVTRDALQIKEGTIGEWIRCINGLPYTEDVPSSIPYHFNHSTRGYRVLVFSGDHDPGVPFLGTQRWVRSFNFSIVDDWRAWHVDGQSAGFTVEYDNHLTFATVKGGGHTAIRHQPKQGFAMGQRWLDNKPL